MVNLRVLFFCTAALAPLATPVFADDPFMTETAFYLGNSVCATTNWCANVGMAVGAESSTSTLIYLLDQDGNTNGIPAVTEGDLLITGTSSQGVTADGVDNVLAVIDFETVSGFTGLTSSADVPSNNVGTSTDPYTGAVAYVYSYNSFGLTAGLPSSYSANTATISNTVQPYIPISGQPGYGTYFGSPPPTAYELVISAPEPSIIVLLITMLGIVGLSLRRRLSGQSE